MLQEVITIATEAGRFLREKAGHPPLKVQEKGARDYVTQVDLQAEALIIERLSRAFPGTRVLAEESGGQRSLDGDLWLVDPLDGTKNFIHGIPVYAVSIAFYTDGKGVLGVVHDPNGEEVFSAERGKGMFLNGRPCATARGRAVAHGLVATGFPFRSLGLLDPYLECFRRIFPQVSGMRRAGSAALDQCYVACGRLNGFWEFGLSPWDMAAGSVMIREGGGIVTDGAGGDDFLFGGDIIAGEPETHALLLREIGAVFEGRRPGA